MNHPLRFPRRLTISSPGCFKKVREQGFHDRGELMDIYALRVEKVDSIFGFTTSRWLKKAVERNKARRLMREAIRLNQRRIEGGWEIILSWQGRIDNVSYVQAEKEIITLLERSGILQTPVKLKGIKG